MSERVNFWAYYLPILVSLLWAAIHDVKTHTIPNKYTAALAVYSLFSVPVRFFTLPGGSFCSLLVDTLLGGLLGGGLLLVTSVATKGGFGGGDVKLMAGLGLAFGMLGVLLIQFLALMLAGITGLIRGKCKEKLRMPFAPFLFFGCAITACFIL